jgi:hypothetical protein
MQIETMIKESRKAYYLEGADGNKAWVSKKYLSPEGEVPDKIWSKGIKWTRDMEVRKAARG